MTDRELKRESKRAFRAVMREMNSSVRFDTPEELEVIRTNFETARKRSLVGLLAGGAACGVGWRYAMGRRNSTLVAAWGAFAGMTMGMFSVRQKTFLDLLSIPENRSPFARRAREVIEKEMPQSPLLSEIRRRRQERFPRADDSYEEIIWTEPPPPSLSDQYGIPDDIYAQAEHDQASFPGNPREGHGGRTRLGSRFEKASPWHATGDTRARDPAAVDEDNEDELGAGTEVKEQQQKKKKANMSWDELRHRASRGF